jgi:four helix bundle protein
MKKANTYRNLTVYKKAFQFSLDILGVSSKIPEHGGEAVKKGLSRASEKTCVKIAEGWCRRAQGNALQEHLDEAALALAEAKLWLVEGGEYNYIHKNDFNRLGRSVTKLNDTIVSMKEELAVAN